MGKSAARMTEPIPPLRDGDRLTTAEFMRRYEASPEGVRAELLNGVVYVNRWIEVGPNGKERIMPPISGGGDGRPQMALSGAIVLYVANTPHVEATAPTTLILSPTDSAPEPDALMRVVPEAGGRSVLGEDDYIHGPPELIIEVANTSAARDMGEKYEMYQRSAVAEYIVWRTRIGEIHWFRRNRAGRYVTILPDEDGILRSRAFPGFWLEAASLAANDLPRVVAVAQAGIASAEHAAFVEKLRRRAERSRR